MRSIVCCLLAAVCWCPAQITPPPQVTEVTAGDVTSRSTVAKTANGREEPVELTEERVVSDSGGVRIVERTVRRFDPNGRPGPPERSRIETVTGGDGTVKTTTTVQRGDLNGRMQVAERSIEVTRKSGDNTDTTVLVERPTLNAGFETVEQREESTRSTGAGREVQTALTQRRDANGRMVDVARRTAERVTVASKTKENVAEYESGSTGTMQLARQTVSETEKRADGSTTTQVDIFETAAPGRARTPGSASYLAKRQVIETKVNSDGTVQTISAALPSASDPNRLGALVKVEQTVCSGTCGKKK